MFGWGKRLTLYQFSRQDSQLNPCKMISYPLPAAGPELVAPPACIITHHHLIWLIPTT